VGLLDELVGKGTGMLEGPQLFQFLRGIIDKLTPDGTISEGGSWRRGWSS